MHMLLLYYYNIAVLEDVEDEFDMTDEWMAGLLQTAFAICFFLSALIFGFLGDRYSRKWLIIGSVFTWGCCSLIASFMPVREMRHFIY